MNCFYCKQEYNKDELEEFVKNEHGCKECIDCHIQGYHGL